MGIKESTIASMCFTLRHDFGLDKRNKWSCGMTKDERDRLRREMEKLFDHHIAEQITENDRLRACLADAQYRVEQGRVWNSMGWTLTGLSPQGQQKVLDAIAEAGDLTRRLPEPRDRQDRKFRLTEEVLTKVAEAQAEHFKSLDTNQGNSDGSS